MPTWTKKDERQYEHVKKSSKERGVREKRAKEIAARTVNKKRREEGKTPNKRTQGTGNPNQSLKERSRDELYNEAKKLDIKGRGNMTKAELVSKVSGTRGGQKSPSSSKSSTKSSSSKAKSSSGSSSRSSSTGSSSKGSKAKASSRSGSSKSSSGSKAKSGGSSSASSKSTSQRSASGGSSVDFEDLTREQLYDEAKKRAIHGRSSMSKDELVANLRYGEGPAKTKGIKGLISPSSKSRSTRSSKSGGKGIVGTLKRWVKVSTGMGSSKK